MLPGWTKTRKRKRTDEEHIEDLDEDSGAVGESQLHQEALTFLNRRQGQRACEDKNLKPTVDRTTVHGAVTALRAGLLWSGMDRLWAADQSVTASARFSDSPPIRRLGMLHELALSSGHAVECRRRITALLIHHECKQKRIPMVKKSMNELSKVAGISLENANDIIPTARAWLRFIKIWGLGGLAMPGPGHKFL